MSQQAAPDPWKSFRGVMAGTLILEAIVVLLALPVVARRRRADGGHRRLPGRPRRRAGAAGRHAGPAVGDLGQPRHPGGADRRWVVSGAVGFIGVVFAGVWLLIAYLRTEVKRRQERGLLPGQQPPPD